MSAAWLIVLLACATTESVRAPARVPLDESLACPVNFADATAKRGIGTGPDEVAAYAQARADAVDRVLDVVCHGDKDARCTYYRSMISEQERGWSAAEGGRACVVMGVEDAVVRDYDKKTQAIRDGVARVADAVKTATDGGGVYFTDARWVEGGCAAPADYLVELLRSELSTRRIDSNDPRGRALQPRLGWAFGPNLRFSLRDERDESVALASFEFEGSLLNLADPRPCEARAPARPGDRAAFDGLVGILDLPGSAGSLCDGDSFLATVRVDRPAYVHVFSVSSDGLAFHVWPPTNRSAMVEERQTIPLRAWRTHRQEEVLVAVAATRPDALGDALSWEGFCRIPSFDEALFSGRAAVAHARYRVGQLGECDGDRGEVDQVLNAMLAAPLCGASP